MTKELTTKPYLLFGAGGHGLVISEILEANNCEILGFIDEQLAGNVRNGYKVFPSAGHYLNLQDVKYLLTIGNNVTRKKLAEQYQLSYGLAIHPSAVISKRAIIYVGTVVMAGVCINTLVRIGQHCIVNTNSTIDHECVLEDYVHISPAAALAGNVYVGEGSHIGIGARILPGVHIGKWCTVGAGAVVTKDVTDNTTVVGVPAKAISKK